MYEISMLLSSVIDLFSKEYLAMGNSLKELLRQEMNLSDLNKKVYQAQVKASKLKKQNTEKEKKLENLGNAELEYEELKASFDAQNTKHEILKAQCLRESIIRLADGTTTFAKRVSTIAEAEKEIASCIPVVPTQIGRKKEYQGEKATEAVVERTADTLNIARPISFCDLLARKNAWSRKLKAKSCFLADTTGENSPEVMDWVTVERSMLASLVDPNRDLESTSNDRRLSTEMFSCLKDQLNIVGPSGRSYISNPGIEQRLAFKARGLSASTENLSPPRPPPPGRHRRKASEPLMDLPRVEPYAVGRWTPNEAGLYARANLFHPGAVTKPRHSSPDGGAEPTIGSTSDSGEYTMPRVFPNENEVVYAVLEQEGTDDTTDKKYIDVVQ
ncbi:uncharacterized protein LOC114524821 isoform X2 [Dendronephthya gigantea]|uniref:uncharacterized protein LOC114524821 isoform X2 n=1 Tax=Dendronephthya gigantea TaxID=151771 RepID=UPI00106CD7F0|nr:uncharacterized protein LOC114524821 isoform X2 [Dendronephthya gigantea]